MKSELLKRKPICMSILLFTFFAHSCKKEPPTVKSELTGDTSIFVGRWNWIYSDHSFGWCDGQSYYEYLDSINTGTTFSISFLTNGIVSFWKDKKIIAENRIIFKFFEIEPQSCMLSSAHPFHIYLNGIGTTYLLGCINSDTMRLSGASGFLFDPVSGCENYQNYFLRQ